MWNAHSKRGKPASVYVALAGIAAATLITMAGAVVAAPVVSANVLLNRAELGIVLCASDGVSMSWRTENDGQAAAPDGWKVERSNQDSEGNPVVQTFTFIGADADALLSSDQEDWEWVDTSADRGIRYTYRVRAIDAGGLDMDGRAWSRNAPVECISGATDEPGITQPGCQDDGVSMFWHTQNGGQATAPDGWKVERSHQDSDGNWVVQTFTFIGDEADALQVVSDGHWDWVDTSAEPYVDYNYRVRAINSDGTDTAGRNWSRYASAICRGGILDQPGISIPRRQANGVAMFWHTHYRGQAEAPEGWKVERRYWDTRGWVVRTFMFIGADADALQTHSDRYWDWVDASADLDVDYTYRVRAINSDGSDMEGRDWSRRAPVEGCADDDKPEETAARQEAQSDRVAQAHNSSCR